MTIDFVVATPHDAIEFNDVYRNTTASAGYIACNNIYNRVVLNEWYDINPFPDLATHWEQLDGSRRWRFHLNKAARWQDGTPLTAHDVVYTHLHAKEMGYTGGRFMKDVETIVAVNDHTVDYHLHTANAGFLVLLGNFIFTHILPRHLYEGTDWATNPHNLKPVGSGPFRLAEWIPGEHVIMEAVKNHWGPQPEIDRLILKIVKDRDECVRMVARGEAHYFPQDTLTKDRLHLLDGATANIELLKDPGPGMALLDFNHGREIWQDKRVREAVAHAVNRAEIAELGDPGVSQAWDHYLLGSVEWSFNPDAKAPAHDAERARALLDEAGMKADASGVRARLSLFYMDSFHGHKPLAELIKSQLGAIGFEVNFEGLSSVDWARRIGREHDFDLIIVGGSMAPDPEITAPKYSTGGENNMAQHRNPDVDAAYLAARTAGTLAERGEHYRRLQEIWARDTEWVPLFWYGTYFARSRDFFGWSDQVGYSVPWWHWGRIRAV
ncbi:ABC transporter substrate-binding protein [Micromonospora peucetia]|uniref:ABC transporter substrate-binding protein n=1 Tax=Micromonospora peucetia TaxID=47871 RepID=A0A1C6U2J4_9ACTN|nr:ABC transporter substrate-binding protein [Micromonospora peucetia]MCX4385958.1 ABC transporter substrate-binding protein [Micromonospora peucetia]WSA33328.1 ABC transporter substrate-binding protein [Micromonospora peucetia]SCL48280.1 peptide/nickel transport system substrate-binding protein [Micromonospora peucetia]